ncbi:MAG TPA: divergent PAP2 family protein [Firmicutes bacterium]|nr:divergent PAP2 family protein [Bacillota bacterium]
MEAIFFGIQEIFRILGLIITNKIFYTTFLAWFLAQTIKVLIFFISHRKFDFRLFVGTGGMPSSHTASVTAGTTIVGLTAGWDSTVFMVCLLYCIVVVSDAVGVRRAAGAQAMVLNKMLDDIEHNDYHAGKRLKELLGHTPLEAMAGMVIGISFAVIMYNMAV